jgi:hypothetical protein
MGKRLSFTLSGNRLTFRNGSGGSLSIPVRTGDDDVTPTDQPDKRHRLSFAEWSKADEERTALTRCGSCNKLMPSPPNPCGWRAAIFDTCPDCLEKLNGHVPG